MRDEHGVDRAGAAGDHHRLLAEALERDGAGAEFVIAAEFLLQGVAYKLAGLTDSPDADRLAEALADEPIGIIAGEMPCDLCSTGKSFAGLVAAVDEPLVHAG